MTQSEQFSAAIDFSTSEIALAVRHADADNPIFTAREPMPPRDSSRIASWTTERLAESNLSLSDITSWTCGTGPGSFTALRCVAALTAGLAFPGGAVKTRGVPSALALAARLADEHPQSANFAL